jgi:hypothetical protein
MSTPSEYGKHATIDRIPSQRRTVSLLESCERSGKTRRPRLILIVAGSHLDCRAGGATLLAAAEDGNVCLLVMGAGSHSRLREMLVGGSDTPHFEKCSRKARWHINMASSATPAELPASPGVLYLGPREFPPGGTGG